MRSQKEKTANANMDTDGLLVSEMSDWIFEKTVDISTKLWYTLVVLLINQQVPKTEEEEFHMYERFETFTVLIAKISRNIRKIKIQEMAEYDLRSVHVSCLYYLYISDNITATELVESYLSGRSRSQQPVSLCRHPQCRQHHCGADAGIHHQASGGASR